MRDKSGEQDLYSDDGELQGERWPSVGESG